MMIKLIESSTGGRTARCAVPGRFSGSAAFSPRKRPSMIVTNFCIFPRNVAPDFLQYTGNGQM